jgi:hypothetical protein
MIPALAFPLALAAGLALDDPAEAGFDAPKLEEARDRAAGRQSVANGGTGFGAGSAQRRDRAVSRLTATIVSSADSASPTSPSTRSGRESHENSSTAREASSRPVSYPRPPGPRRRADGSTGGAARDSRRGAEASSTTSTPAPGVSGEIASDPRGLRIPPRRPPMGGTTSNT